MIDNEKLLNTLGLLEAVDRNVRIVHDVSNYTPVFCLNEIRYAMRHLLLGVTGKGDEDHVLRAQAHLRRAYYDSCDELLDSLMRKGYRRLSKCALYDTEISKRVKEYEQYKSALFEARERRRSLPLLSSDLTGDSREAFRSQVVKLLKLDARVDAYWGEIDAVIHRMRLRFVLRLSLLLLGVLIITATFLCLMHLVRG